MESVVPFARLADRENSIQYFAALTEHSLPNSEFEAHAHHEEFEIYWFLEGSLFFAFEGQRIEILPGDMVILCSSQLHKPIIRQPCRYFRKRILFRKDIFTQLGENAYALQYQLLRRKLLLLHTEEVLSSGLDQYFSEIEEQLALQTPYGDFSAMISLLHLLITAERTCPGTGDGETLSHGGKADALIKYIDEHISDDLSYLAIAKKFGISEKSLYKFFRQETGFSLGKYITARRIIKARSLLNAGCSAADAAIAAGFQDYSSFYRSFLKETGVSPIKYAKSR